MALQPSQDKQLDKEGQILLRQLKFDRKRGITYTGQWKENGHVAVYVHQREKIHSQVSGVANVMRDFLLDRVLNPTSPRQSFQSGNQEWHISEHM